MDLNPKVEFLKFHDGSVRGVAFSPVVSFKIINTELTSGRHASHSIDSCCVVVVCV